MSSDLPLRIAIVGCGPKGLFALERLVELAREIPAARLDVDVYEPHPAPGAGPWYDPNQPGFLRMNFAAEAVDMWPPSRTPDPDRPTFVEWREHRFESTGEAYPPRAQVGEYLRNGYGTVLSRAPEGVDITEISDRVAAVDRDEDGWALRAAEPRRYDEVLIATGHAARWGGAIADPGAIEAVFPLETRLSPEAVPPGSTVAIRGFALTMIDASLALTEGRGGRFRDGRAPHLLDYETGESDVSRILPYSRTGRPMLAKPEPGRAFNSPELDRIAERGREDVAIVGAERVLEDVMAVVEKVAQESLRAAGASGEVESWFGEVLAGETPSGGDPATEIERSIAIGVGAADVDPVWAIGHAWRAVYPALVERLGAGGLAENEWPRFRFVAAEMERVAFGPPPVNAAKLLALIERGVVDLSHLDPGTAPDADVTIDAVLPAPGAREVEDSLLTRLVRDGYARTAPGRRGLELTGDVTCIGADGRPSVGLGAIGRPTEDWVIGNDTLNRSLHPHPEIWARRVIRRAAR